MKGKKDRVFTGKLFDVDKENSFHFFTYFEPSDTYLVVHIPESELITDRLNNLIEVSR